MLQLSQMVYHGGLTGGGFPRMVDMSITNTVCVHQGVGGWAYSICWPLKKINAIINFCDPNLCCMLITRLSDMPISHSHLIDTPSLVSPRVTC